MANLTLPDADQQLHMRQAMMDSLRVEMQEHIKSRVGPLENELRSRCYLLEHTNAAQQAEIAQLKQQCDLLERATSTFIQKRAEDETKIDEMKSMLQNTMRKANYLGYKIANRDWEYPLLVPTVDELCTDHGFDLDEAIETYRFILRLMDYTTGMRRADEKVIDEYIITLEPSSDYPSRYHCHDILLPHWQQFTSALLEFGCFVEYFINYFEDSDAFFSLIISNIELSEPILRSLVENLPRFQQLEFTNNLPDGAACINFITQCIESNPRLSEFVWRSNTLENSPMDIERLYEAISSHEGLYSLKFEDCENEDQILHRFLIKVKSRTLQHVELVSNRLSNLRQTDMAEFLASNPLLACLDLSKNPFTHQDVILIADAIKHNTTLRVLKLCTNLDQSYLFDSLVFDDTSLNALYHSNHSCKIRHSFSHQPFRDLDLNPYHDRNLNLKRKIYTLLSRRNRQNENAACFDSEGIMIKHLPHILSLLKPYSEHNYCDQWFPADADEVKPLSITYEIMKGWKMPELYNLCKVDVSEDMTIDG
eukprot:scaffold80795_cov76-Cyclotella_meneghiniana.AAC.3